MPGLPSPPLVFTHPVLSYIHCERPHVHYRYPGLSLLLQQLPLLRAHDAYVCTIFPQENRPEQACSGIEGEFRVPWTQIIPRLLVPRVWSRRRHAIGFRWAHSHVLWTRSGEHPLKLRAQGRILPPQILGRHQPKGQIVPVSCMFSYGQL